MNSLTVYGEGTMRAWDLISAEQESVEQRAEQRRQARHAAWETRPHGFTPETWTPRFCGLCGLARPLHDGEGA